MTVASSVVKITAKTTLKNNWLNSIAACVTLIFSTLICILSADYIGYISNIYAAYAIICLLAVFLLIPLFFGLLRYFWRMILGAHDKPISVFYYFSDKISYKRALSLTLSLVWRCAVVGILLFLPSIIVDIFTGAKVYDLLDIPIPLWTSNLYYLSVFLKTVAFVILIFIMSRYYLAPFLISADENMDVDEAIHMSVIVARNTILDYIYLIFSFFGWLLLSLLVFPLIFTMPYFLTSVAVHVRFSIADYNKKIEQNSSVNSFPTFEGV